MSLQTLLKGVFIKPKHLKDHINMMPTLAEDFSSSLMTVFKDSGVTFIFTSMIISIARCHGNSTEVVFYYSYSG